VESFSARGELKSSVTTGMPGAGVTVFNGWTGIPGVSAVVEMVFRSKGTAIEAENDVIAVLSFWRLEFWELDELPYTTISVTLPGHPLFDGLTVVSCGWGVVALCG
jgi:hypothetical protein